MRQLVLVALVGAGLGCRGGGGKHATAVEVTRTEVVRKGALVERVLLTGELRAASSTDLVVPRTEAWQLAIRWMAEDGATVKAGDRVLEFDNSAFTAKLEEGRLAMLEAEMTYQSASELATMEGENKQNALRQAQIALEKAKVRADVPADLLAAREAQERQLEKKRAEVAVKKAEADVAAQQQEAALDLKVKQIALEKARRVIEAAEKTIDNLVLKAPKDGVAIVDEHPWEGRKFHVGDTVQPGFTILSMPDLAQGMEVNSDLSDVDDGRVAVGMTGTCTLDAYPASPIACTVTDLTPVARVKGEKSLRRAFAIRLALARTDADRMRPGMSVKIELPRPPLQNSLLVPRGAVVTDGKTARVRLAGGLRDVTLGVCDAQHCTVMQGVAEGETVIVGGGV